MTNVIVFPRKVFREWGPIAQALARYLTGLGATTSEARDIVDRLQAKWMEYGTPLTRPVLRQIAGSPPTRPDCTNDAGIRYHVREMPRKPGHDRAASLFELAKLDFDESKSG